MLTKTCVTCGKAFQPKQKRSGRPQDFCSQACYHGFRHPIPELPCLSRGFGDWLAGFTDGEGHFAMNVRKNDNIYFGFMISLRADDGEILETIQKMLKIGNITTHTHKDGKGEIALKWSIQTAHECAMIVRLFEKYPLRAKKAREFAIWAEGVREKLKGPQQDKNHLLKLRRQLLDVRQWVTSAQRITYQYRFVSGGRGLSSLVPQTPWGE